MSNELLDTVTSLMLNSPKETQDQFIAVIHTLAVSSHKDTKLLEEKGIEEAFVAALKIALPSRDNSLTPTEIIQQLTDVIPDKNRATELVQKVTTDLNSLSVRFFGLNNPAIALNRAAIHEVIRRTELQRMVQQPVA